MPVKGCFMSFLPALLHRGQINLICSHKGWSKSENKSRQINPTAKPKLRGQKMTPCKTHQNRSNKRNSELPDQGQIPHESWKIPHGTSLSPSAPADASDLTKPFSLQYPKLTGHYSELNLMIHLFLCLCNERNCKNRQVQRKWSSSIIAFCTVWAANGKSSETSCFRRFLQVHYPFHMMMLSKKYVRRFCTSVQSAGSVSGKTGSRRPLSVLP